jgi:YidC/Oxa1 family membrane protein insertase
MFSNIFNTFFYNPIYNGLILLESSFSWMDLGVAVVLITLIIKLILFPLTKSSIRTQIQIKKIEPELNKLKEQHKDDKQAQALKMMELYRENQIKPFSSFFLVLIQLPVLFALYFVFLKSGLPEINTDILYSFVKTNAHINNVNFLGFIDITQKSLLLALTASVSQFFQIRLVMPKIENKTSGEKTLKDDMMKNMQLQMKYVMPVFIFFVAYGLLSAVALYWTTSNLFMIAQELYMRKTIKAEENHGK